jgi:hypothetical protein
MRESHAKEATSEDEADSQSQAPALREWPDVEPGETFWDWMDKVNALTWRGG